MRCNDQTRPGIESHMGRTAITGAALLALLAVTAVLISPMPDELPGTAAKRAIVSFAIAVSAAPGPMVEPEALVTHTPSQSHLSLDLLSVTCARLC